MKYPRLEVWGMQGVKGFSHSILLTKGPDLPFFFFHKGAAPESKCCPTWPKSLLFKDFSGDWKGGSVQGLWQLGLEEGEMIRILFPT